jgi:hypothetical protein
MNIRPTVDFDDKYLNAKCKVIECIKALNQLTPEQNQQLARGWQCHLNSSYTTWRMEDKDNAH